jgi:hypothetical protein
MPSGERSVSIGIASNDVIDDHSVALGHDQCPCRHRRKTFAVSRFATLFWDSACRIKKITLLSGDGDGGGSARLLVEPPAMLSVSSAVDILLLFSTLFASFSTLFFSFFLKRHCCRYSTKRMAPLERLLPAPLRKEKIFDLHGTFTIHRYSQYQATSSMFYVQILKPFQLCH